MRATSPSHADSDAFCSCTCAGAGPRPPPQGMEISEVEFVQIIIILLVMTFMIVVILCLLNQQRLSALAFLSRLSQQPAPQASGQDASVWTNVMRTTHTNSLSQAMCAPPSGSLAPVPLRPPLQQRWRFQPTYPYLPQETVNLPPSIRLSDGEEPPPYGGPCRLQLRAPEQQLELLRASVRAPPNRSIFHRHLTDLYLEKGAGPPRPPHGRPTGGFHSNKGPSPEGERGAEPDGSQTEVAAPPQSTRSQPCSQPQPQPQPNPNSKS